jgi:hypothetical protein
MRQCARNWTDRQYSNIRKTLARYVPGGATAAADDPRGFEWYYWDRMVHSADLTLQADGAVISLAWSTRGHILYTTDVTGQLLEWNNK